MRGMLDVIARASKGIGLVELARRLGIRHQSFYSWDKVPAERVLALEKISGIHRSEIRPDLYPARRRGGRAA